MQEISSALGLECNFKIHCDEYLPSQYAVSDLAAWSFGGVGCALASLMKQLGFACRPQSVEVNRRLASLWYASSIHPVDWELPPVWDAIAGDYQTSDGWIKLHTNFSHHRAAALSVLDVETDRDEVSKAVLKWDKEKLEDAIIEAGGVSAAMRTRQEWLTHPQGLAVSAEPLISWVEGRQAETRNWGGTMERPLAGLRVLDLTRVLAGPVATRTLAGFGASILRIDPPGWEEANIVPDITLGKNCARLDLKSKHDRLIFEQLLADADILVHGYRPGALEGLGYAEAVRSKISPNLIEISLNAYGWTGPWRERRGFDSLVQMSCGIADAGRHWAEQSKPTPLPVQALDHATGYLMAAAAIRALDDALARKGTRSARLSLARTAELLASHPQEQKVAMDTELRPKDFTSMQEKTPWGIAKRLAPALSISGTDMEWRLPASELGSVLPSWNLRPLG